MANTPHDPERSEAAQTLADLEAVLARIHGLSQLAADLRAIRALVLDGRPPRVAAVGRRGSGKSSLANALLGAKVLDVGAVDDTTREPQWLDLERNQRKVRWIDTPGLRAGGNPERSERVAALLAKDPPDVLLFCVRATQVDAGIDDDIDDLKTILTAIEGRGAAKPPVVAVVTRVDELAPPLPKQPPFGDEKRGNIDKAVEVLKRHFERKAITVAATVPVGAFAKYFSDGSIAIDWRYNVDSLASAVFDALPQLAQTEAAMAFETSRALRRRVARRIITGATSIAFFIGAAPLPHDLVVLTPLQGVMVMGVSFLSERASRARMVAEWTAGMGLNVGAGVALRAAARSLIKLVPGFGGAISGAVAAGGTWALGLAAIKYFIDGATIDETRAEFEKVKQAGLPKDFFKGSASEKPSDTLIETPGSVAPAPAHHDEDPETKPEPDGER
ncbi:MAG: 50S ribosome-binding GTPase [Myxococcales bacterium]|nr:50S ribosome-binding GTPase [Myxococcales bacterium]